MLYDDAVVNGPVIAGFTAVDNKGCPKNFIKQPI